MSYLCGMKKFSILALLTVIYFFPQMSNAQVYGTFDPGFIAFSSTAHAGTQTFTTTLQVDSHFDTRSAIVLVLTCSAGIRANPDTIVANGHEPDEYVNITVQVNPDSIQNCYGGGEPAAVFVQGGSVQPLWVYGYIYDSQIQGRVKLESDSLNFGNVPIGVDSSLKLDIKMDMDSSAYPTLELFGVASPFSFTGGFLPDYSQCDRQFYDNAFFSFSPKQIGKYVDTVYIFNPIRKDSTMLILLGEGVAAGVSPEAADANALRINPNPCDRSAAISLSGGGIEEVTAQNILGEQVLESRMEPCNSFNMNTSELPAGIYFVEVRSRENHYWQHIVVSH